MSSFLSYSWLGSTVLVNWRLLKGKRAEEGAPKIFNQKKVIASSNSLQHSCLENPMDRGASWARVHGITKGGTWLSNWACYSISSQEGRTEIRKLSNQNEELGSLEQERGGRREQGGPVRRRWSYRKEAGMRAGNPGLFWGAPLEEATVLPSRTGKQPELTNEYSRISSIFIHVFILSSTNIYYVPSIQQALCWILRKELMLCQNISKLRKLHSPVLEARREGVDGWWLLLLNRWPLSQGPYCFML